MRYAYTCPACGDVHDDTVDLFHEGGWTWTGGPVLGDPLPCGVLPTSDQIADIEAKIIDHIVHEDEPDA